MRCPDCNKFVSYGDLRTDDVIVALADTDHGTLEVTGSLYLTCADCGTDLKELRIEETRELVEAFPPVRDELKTVIPEEWWSHLTEEWIAQHVQAEYSLADEPNLEPTDRGTKSKTYYGVCVSGTARRVLRFSDEHGAEPKTTVTHESTIDYSIDIEELSSSFEECC